MNREHISNQEADLSDASIDQVDQVDQVDQASQDSIFVVPDLEEQNSHSSILEDDYTESSSEQIPEYYQVYNTKNTKSTETSPVESQSSIDSPLNSDTLFKRVGENDYCCNEVAKTHEGTPFRTLIDFKSVLNNEQKIEQEGHPAIRYTINEYGLYDAKNLTTHNCNNSKENINNSSKTDFLSTCITEKKKDDKELSLCHGKSNETVAGQSKTNKTPNYAINIDSKKASVANVSKNQSKDSIKCSQRQDEKKVNGGSACSTDKSKPCCANVLNTPPCPSVPIKQKEKYPPSVCCRILQKFKESSSLSAFHRCLSQYSTNQNESPSICDDKVDCEGLRKRPKAADEKKDQCKKSPSNCSNILIIEGSETINEEGLAVIQLDKRPSNFILTNLENNSQSMDEPMRYTDIEIPGSPNMSTDSQRNFETYFGFHDHSSRKMCMKVKVIPSKTNAVEDVVSLIKMTINQDETIPTCKITSDDLTSMAKDFFGTIYKRTKDAMTIISSESARLLDLVMRTSISVNTDESSLQRKLLDDKCVETSSLPQMCFTMPNVDQAGTKASIDVGSTITDSLQSLGKPCACNESLKSPQHAHTVSPPQPNSVFSTIKTKICSIFREECDAVNIALRKKVSESSEESEQITNNSESEESVIREDSLRKTI